MMVPWYPTMGNHDWLKLPEGTEGGQKGNGWAQVLLFLPNFRAHTFIDWILGAWFRPLDSSRSFLHDWIHHQRGCQSQDDPRRHADSNWRVPRWSSASSSLWWELRRSLQFGLRAARALSSRRWCCWVGLGVARARAQEFGWCGLSVCHGTLHDSWYRRNLRLGAI